MIVRFGDLGPGVVTTCPPGSSPSSDYSQCVDSAGNSSGISFNCAPGLVPGPNGAGTADAGGGCYPPGVTPPAPGQGTDFWTGLNMTLANFRNYLNPYGTSGMPKVVQSGSFVLPLVLTVGIGGVVAYALVKKPKRRRA